MKVLILHQILAGVYYYYYYYYYYRHHPYDKFSYIDRLYTSSQYKH